MRGSSFGKAGDMATATANYSGLQRGYAMTDDTRRTAAARLREELRDRAERNRQRILACQGEAPPPPTPNATDEDGRDYHIPCSYCVTAALDALALEAAADAIDAMAGVITTAEIPDLPMFCSQCGEQKEAEEVQDVGDDVICHECWDAISTEQP